MFREGQPELASIKQDLSMTIFDYVASVLHLFIRTELSVMFSQRILSPKYCTKLLRIAVVIFIKLLIGLENYPLVYLHIVPLV